MLVVALTAQIVRAEEKKEPAPWKTRVEVSYTDSSGNSEAEALSGKLETKREGDVNRYFGKASVFRTEDDNEETANKWLADVRWERVLQKRLFAFIAADYLKDKFSGFDYKVGAGPGLGFDIYKTDRHSLKGLLAIYYYYEKFSKGPRSKDDYIAGKASLNYEWQIFENMKFQEDLSFIESFKDSEKYFVNSETAVEFAIQKNLSLRVSYTVAYQNEPPSPDVKNSDRVFFTSLIIDF